MIRFLNVQTAGKFTYAHVVLSLPEDEGRGILQSIVKKRKNYMASKFRRPDPNNCLLFDPQYATYM